MKGQIRATCRNKTEVTKVADKIRTLTRLCEDVVKEGDSVGKGVRVVGDLQANVLEGLG